MQHKPQAKKVIIVGASSGIGMELAKLYVASGCVVGITARREELLKNFQRQFPAQVFIERFDVTAPDVTPHLRRLIEALDGLDILIYSAGFGEVSETLSWEIDYKMTTTNVNGFISIANYAFNYFLKQGSGQLAAISSIASIRGNSRAPAYSAAKAFMSRYLEGLSIKAWKTKMPNGAKPGIIITDIQPGFVNTKPIDAPGAFWIAPVEKAAQQIYRAIEKKKRRVYITRRWAFIAWLLKVVPYSVYKRFG